jgi:hypothetical protein
MHAAMCELPAASVAATVIVAAALAFFGRLPCRQTHPKDAILVASSTTGVTYDSSADHWFRPKDVPALGGSNCHEIVIDNSPAGFVHATDRCVEAAGCGGAVEEVCWPLAWLQPWQILLQRQAWCRDGAVAVESWVGLKLPLVQMILPGVQTTDVTHEVYTYNIWLQGHMLFTLSGQLSG